jgi:hypothetical protein
MQMIRGWECKMWTLGACLYSFKQIRLSLKVGWVGWREWVSSSDEEYKLIYQSFFVQILSSAHDHVQHDNLW